MGRIQFTYSQQLPTGIQDHGVTHNVAIDDDGTPGYTVLVQAERRFLNWFAESKPDHKLLSWVAASEDGSRYSEYRTFLANDL